MKRDGFLPQYRGSSIKSQGAYLISDIPEGGLIERGGLIEKGAYLKKSSDKGIFGSFSVHLPYILQIQHAILRLKDKNSIYIVFIPNHTKINLKGCIAK